MRLSWSFALAVIALAGCTNPYADRPPNLCDELAVRCGGRHAGNWWDWCQGECVPDYARTIPCEANAGCALCDAPDASGNNTQLFSLPGELEYMWTLTDDPREPIHPETEPAPTGGAFRDEPDSFVGVHPVGAWQAYEPFEGLPLGATAGFCEPGPNRYLIDNVVGTNGGMVLRAERMPEEFSPAFCPGGRCRVGPYPTCDAPPTGCQYREQADPVGLGFSSQSDRVGASDTAETYGYGRFRAVFRPAGDGTPPEPGFVYAFFTQDNLACVDGMPNIETNTSELDVEISSGLGEAGGERFCETGEICLQVSTWVSSEQGLASDGVLRHQVSGFRFRTNDAAAENHTYGWDWERDDVRFTYDADPADCDEASGACSPDRASMAICRHLRFIPRRPSPLHFQLWNAWWAGNADRGTEALMTVERVWHTPY